VFWYSLCEATDYWKKFGKRRRVHIMCISAIDRKRSVGQNQICAKTLMKIYMEITPCNPALVKLLMEATRLLG
jgi:hypothetical protein